MVALTHRVVCLSVRRSGGRVVRGVGVTKTITLNVANSHHLVVEGLVRGAFRGYPLFIKI